MAISNIPNQQQVNAQAPQYFEEYSASLGQAWLAALTGPN